MYIQYIYIYVNTLYISMYIHLHICIHRQAPVAFEDLEVAKQLSQQLAAYTAECDAEARAAAEHTELAKARGREPEPWYCIQKESA